MHDQFILAAASLLGVATGLDEPLVYYRQHENNVMGAQKKSLPEKIRRIFSDFFSGRFRAEKQAFLQSSRDTAGELQKLRSLSKEDRRFLSQYVSLGGESKRARLRFYKKYHIERTTKAQTLWMYLWA